MELADIKDVSVFADHVGTEFRIETGPDQYANAELIEAEALKTGPASAALPRHPFSLLFAVRGDIDLPQRTYRVEHEQLGELPLFLVPLGQGRMESIFN